jgi:group I intron endonuclease
MDKYCVYKHTAPNGKVYIGITMRNPTVRFRNGGGYSENEHFSRAISKYGWNNFAHEILFSGLTADEASAMESELIDRYSSMNPKYGYNKTSGGQVGTTISMETREKLSRVRKAQGNFRMGTHHSEEAKRKIGAGNKGKVVIIRDDTRRKISEALTGITRSEETRKRMSAAKKGCSHPQYDKWIPVEQVDIATKSVIKKYGSMALASRETNTRYTGISRCCRGEIKTSNGFIWRYAIDDSGRREAS